MSYEEAEESDTWCYSSMVTAEDLQIQVSTSRTRIDELRSELQENDTRISRLENDKYLLQRQNDDNRTTIKKLEDTIDKLRNDHKDQESLQGEMKNIVHKEQQVIYELLKEKDQDIQTLSDTNEKYENRLQTLEKEERAWSQKSEEMEKEIRKLKERIQSFKESCCCKQGQVDVHDQNRRNADRTKDVTSPIRQIDNKMKDEDLYEEGKSILYKDERREARKKERIQSFKESCCCKQGQVDVHDQNRRNADRTKDVTSPIRQIDNKMKDEDLYEEGKSILYKDERREARKKSSERGNDICENCNIRSKTGTLSSCKHELCWNCLDVMRDRKVRTDQKSHKKKVTCSCLHCTMKVSLNEVDNLLMTLAE